MFFEGQVVQGAKSAYRLIEPLKTKEHILSTLWKARVLDSAQYKPAKFVIMKTANWERFQWLEREGVAYEQPSIRSSLYIRSLYDEINVLRGSQFESKEALRNAFEKAPYCLVLEYLDCPLDSLDPEEHKRNLKFVATYFTSTLTGLSHIEQAEAIWTDGKAENILCSNAGGPDPVVKIADLGLSGPTGYDAQQLQPKQTRAPEVWTGNPCTHVADVWSIAAAFVSWIDRSVFGLSDFKPDVVFEDGWCIAKILRGFETDEDKMPPPPLKAAKYIKNVHKLGCLLLTQENDGTPESMHVPGRPFFAEVLPELGLAPEVGALLRKMLVLDPEKRLTAKALLRSDECDALVAAAK